MADDPRPIGWLRAILSAAIIVAVGIGALVYGSNAVLTKVHGKTRSSLVAVVTIGFFVVLFAMAWLLRRLQKKRVI
jgi:hypothetical protein